MIGTTVGTVDGLGGGTRRRTGGSAEEALIAARRTTVRGGLVCGRRAPVLRLAVITDDRGARQVQRSRVTSTHRGRGHDRHSVAARANDRRLRLTPRGRLVLVVLPIAAVVAAVLVAVAGPLAEASSTPAPSLTTLTVRPGDSLWSIAERLAPADDPRDVIAEVERVNGMTNADLRAGQVIAVPGEYSSSIGHPAAKNGAANNGAAQK